MGLEYHIFLTVLLTSQTAGGRMNKLFQISIFASTLRITIAVLNHGLLGTTPRINDLMGLEFAFQHLASDAGFQGPYFENDYYVAPGQ